MKPLTVCTPMFKHDCSNCVFLGTYAGHVYADNDNSRVLHDLYFCPNIENPEFPTVIARYGNKGEEYQSGMTFASADGILPLYEARLRAERYGLLQATED